MQTNSVRDYVTYFGGSQNSEAKNISITYGAPAYALTTGDVEFDLEEYTGFSPLAYFNLLETYFNPYNPLVYDPSYTNFITEWDEFPEYVIFNDELYESNILLYPNPTKNKLNIILEEFHDISRIEIYSISGLKIFDKFIESNTYTVDVTSFSAGLYTLFLTTDYFITITKFEKL